MLVMEKSASFFTYKPVREGLNKNVKNFIKGRYQNIQRGEGSLVLRVCSTDNFSIFRGDLDIFRQFYGV